MYYTGSQYTSVFGIVQMSGWIFAPVSGRLMARNPHNKSEYSPHHFEDNYYVRKMSFFT